MLQVPVSIMDHKVEGLAYVRHNRSRRSVGQRNHIQCYLLENRTTLDAARAGARGTSCSMGDSSGGTKHEQMVVFLQPGVSSVTPGKLYMKTIAMAAIPDIQRFLFLCHFSKFPMLPGKKKLGQKKG